MSREHVLLLIAFWAGVLAGSMAVAWMTVARLRRQYIDGWLAGYRERGRAQRGWLIRFPVGISSRQILGVVDEETSERSGA